ncbi:DUF1707 SHOCT-like domain-containing protein [Thermocatellispora tengchongensis]
MRASDADRDRVAQVLRENFAEGRLTSEEFDERLERLYQSKTYGELAVLTNDLPATDLRLYRERAETPAKRAQKSRKRAQTLSAMWVPWAMASGINWVIWVLVSMSSDGPVYPWPLWVMGPWGVVLLVITLATGLGSGDSRRSSP